MKVFEHETKVNFVDENNVLVGYDLEQACCEDAGWFIASSPCEDVPSSPNDKTDYPGFVFDVGYDSPSIEDQEFELYMTVFRLTKGTEQLFVHLYNIHNGYYGHGFEMKDGEKVVSCGCV
jgi:hypothetical protein